MGFYHGSSEPPPSKERFGGLKEVWAVIVAVFSVLAWPLALIFGGIAWLVITFVLFGVHWSLGLLSLALMAVAIAVFAYWDRHRAPNLPT